MWFMQYKRLNSPNLIWIDAKALVINLIYILSLISSLREENDESCKSHIQPRKKKYQICLKKTLGTWEEWEDPSIGQMSKSWA